MRHMQEVQYTKEVSDAMDGFLATMYDLCVKTQYLRSNKGLQNFMFSSEVLDEMNARQMKTLSEAASCVSHMGKGTPRGSWGDFNSKMADVNPSSPFSSSSKGDVISELLAAHNNVMSAAEQLLWVVPARDKTITRMATDQIYSYDDGMKALHELLASPGISAEVRVG